MNNRDLYNSFNIIDDVILERSEKTTASNVVPIRRRLSAALIAAILALLLMGAGVAAVIWADNIQSWFAYYWEKVTGQPMSDQHTALIEHLSQEIDLSETVNGVTVTVDSAMVGEKQFVILLRIDGLEFSEKHRYGFEETQVVLMQATTDHAVDVAGYSYDFLGLDSKGGVLLLIHYNYTTRGSDLENKPPFQVTLSMTNFAQDPKTFRHLLLVEGTWNFTFSMERNKLEAKKLPDTQIMGVDYSKKDGNHETPIILTNMELTNTDFSFQYDWQGGNVVTDIRLHQVRVVLKNGQEITASSSAGTGLSDSQWYCAYFWRIPVDLDEVVAVKIGEVVIPIE